MAQETINAVISYLLNQLAENSVKVNKLILFGSHSNETANENSDLDIGIISDDFHNKNLFERSKLISHAERMTIRKFMVPLDLVMLTPEELNSESTLIASYIKQGIEVYAA